MEFNMDNFKRKLHSRQAVVDECLRSYTQAHSAPAAVISQGIDYALHQSGKRLRPIMLLEGAAIAGVPIKQALPFSIAVEMIHTYSLIHDDLPAMDDDELRRGMPTCHIEFGEANAILIGDALLTDAFAWLGKNATITGIAPAAVLRAITLIAEGTGSLGMVSGQALDMDNNTGSSGLSGLQRLHSLKTAAFFKACLLAGAALGNMPAQPQQSLANYAEHFGLAFQITDDILDATGNTEILGKPAGSDRKNQKNTYTSLLGTEAAQAAAQTAVDACLKDLESFSAKADFLRQLAIYLLHRRS